MPPLPADTSGLMNAGYPTSALEPREVLGERAQRHERRRGDAALAQPRLHRDLVVVIS